MVSSKGQSPANQRVRDGLDLKIEMRAVEEVKPYSGNAKTHSPKQVTKIAASIRTFGFNNPILIDADDRIIAGHGRFMAAKELGLGEVPTIRLSHLSEAERRAYVIADNRLAELGGWDKETLKIELGALIEMDLDFDVELTGFETGELDLILDGEIPKALDPKDDAIPALSKGPSVSRLCDLWLLGEHRLLCADATDPDAYRRLMGEEPAAMAFADPPYNVKIDGNVSGSGKHGEFVMASGEMSKVEFTDFLAKVFANMAAVSTDGAIHFQCMDWRHIEEMTLAGQSAYSELKNLIVWDKGSGGMGTFYRSQHELVFVFKVGTAPHQNHFGLGANGRYRTNLWTYGGAAQFGKGRAEALEMHPTVKPVAMVADAIRDVSRKGEIVLDAFGGSGTTLIAAQKTGRRARLLELDPRYCDVICRRFERHAKTPAVLAESGQCFEEVKALREGLEVPSILEGEAA